jgi:hypothetical protein
MISSDVPSEQVATSPSGYYFQHRMKGYSTYLATLSPGRWERWREDWVLVQADVHERLTLPTAASTAPRVD